MSEISDKVMAKINEENIKPLPKTYFRIRNFFWWGDWYYQFVNFAQEVIHRARFYKFFGRDIMKQ